MGVTRILLQAAALALFMAGCCTPRTLQNTAAHHDTIEVVKVQRDSVERWHTRTELVKGDTVWRIDSVVVERWRDRWRDSVVIKRDTVQQVEVQQVEVQSGGIPWWWLVVAALAGGVAVWIKKRQ